MFEELYDRLRAACLSDDWRQVARQNVTIGGAHKVEGPYLLKSGLGPILRTEHTGQVPEIQMMNNC